MNQKFQNWYIISPILKNEDTATLRVHDGLHDHWLLCEIQYFYMAKERK